MNSDNLSENEYIILPMDNITVLPGSVIAITVFDDPDVIRGIKDAFNNNKKVLFVTKSKHGAFGLYPAGTVGTVKTFNETDPAHAQIEIEGEIKGNVINVYKNDGINVAEVKLEDDSYARKEVENDPILAEAMKRELRDGIHRYMEYSNAPAELKNILIGKWDNTDDLVELMTHIMGNIPVDFRARQAFLESKTLNNKYEILQTQLNYEINVMRVRKVIFDKVASNMQEENNEHFLREQLRAINEELYGTEKDETEEFTEKLDKLNAPDEVKEKIEKEIRRLRKTNINSPDAGVIRDYINTLFEVPWEDESAESCDLDEVKKVLDADHYGLDKVKDRIIESLAVMNVAPRADVPVICLFGPPGTGKTSIAKSVAAALNREFIRVALGGVRDEAEIRGHRRTYVGALPGRIINGLIKAKVKNPVMLFDEIDKMGTDYRTDPEAAMLEILDGEQNDKFVDHYVELPVDLSKVLFICTANDLSTISEPLLDRMEIIELNSYTENEKLHIAKEHLIPKQIVKNGLTPENVKFTDKAIELIISKYTAEAGVRNLERQIAAVCRKITKDLYDNGEIDNKKVTVNQNNIETYLGNPKINKPKVIHKPLKGVVHGLAWTQVGGAVIEIEVETMPGKGQFILTGKMGDVMQESARIALSCVRGVLKNSKKGFFDKNDIHMHIPAGAVPKDGPSAGIAMATAIYSAVTGKKVDGNTAMTGEITLTGVVLPIGGLKEKMLAANKAGMKKIIVPEANKGDVSEFDDEVKGDLEIVFVTHFSQVIKEIIIQ